MRSSMTASVLLRLLCMILIWVSSCSAPYASTTYSATTETIVQATTKTPFPTQMTHAILPTHVSYPNGTQSPTVSMTPTMIATISPTPPPTLTTDEAQNEIFELLKTNGGCRLPCLWGLTPGKTSVQDARLFLERYGSVTRGTIFDATGGYIDIQVPQNGLLVTSKLTYYEYTSKETIERITGSINIVRELEGGYKTAYEDPLFAQLLELYSIPQILNTYGQPSQVLVQAIRGQWLFYVLLSYPKDGFLMHYVSPFEEDSGTYFGCPYKARIEILLWPPERSYSLEEAALTIFGDRFGKEWLAGYLPIEDVTSLTQEEFYTAFSDPINASCLETPLDLWPEP